MYSEAKKLRIIEEVLKINNDGDLTALQNFIEKSLRNKDRKKAGKFSEFSGIWSKEEADEIEKIITESCEF